MEISEKTLAARDRDAFDGGFDAAVEPMSEQEKLSIEQLYGAHGIEAVRSFLAYRRAGKNSPVPIVTGETAEQKAHRLETAFRAIFHCTLTGVDYGDWVQAVCEDALNGEWPECWNCGTAVHEGPCAGDEESS